ncbi:Cryptochrome-1 [Chelonia mydas]|uniref:Cryptochrome-1 n=1 Tax=Chelonia mydas TaxID=8469 RepID=M7BP00_CHEMY|nr:Cryptochrome-1 [Chelonia mydas]
MGVNAVHWFRKGLRLHDNPALRECIQGADSVRCVYILDPWFAGSSNVGINRWRKMTFDREAKGSCKSDHTPFPSNPGIPFRASRAAGGAVNHLGVRGSWECPDQWLSCTGLSC